MREQEVVGDGVRLRRGVAVGAGDAQSKRVGAAARREVALVVAADGLDVGLVHRDPVLHPVAEAPEAHVCVRGEVFAAYGRHARRSGGVDSCHGHLHMHVCVHYTTYMILGLSRPLYSSWRAWGRSK